MFRFCETCGERTAYVVHREIKEKVIHGVTFSVEEEVATCSVCGSPVYVPEIHDTNIDRIDTAYRKAVGIITLDEIKSVMEKYDIAANPLSKVLGFGEVTVARYLAGQTPSKSCSERLLQVLNSEAEMESCLLKAKDDISDVAFRKCYAAIERLKEFGVKAGKIELATQYLINKLTDVTPLALQKLLYYTQAFFSALNDGVFMFTDDCQAWQHGPVYPHVYNKYKAYGYNPIEANNFIFINPEHAFSLKELEVLDNIANTFGLFSGTVLKKITHLEEPWTIARNGLDATARSTNIISKEAIFSYFTKVVNEYEIDKAEDIGKYCNAMISRI